MRRLTKTITSSLFLLIAATVPIFGRQAPATADQDKCRAVVQEFYNWYSKTKGDWEQAIKRPVFGAQLRLILSDESAWQKGHTDDVGLDFDPILNTQEEPYKHYVAGKVTTKNGHCLVEVTSPESEEKDQKPIVVPELAIEQGHWVFVNFHYGESEYPENENLISVLKEIAKDRKN